MDIKRVFDIFDVYENERPQKIALAGKQDGIWQTYSWKEYKDLSTATSYGLMKIGVKPGDNIITIVGNRPEWNFLDMGILMCGAVHVPVYPNISNNDYEYIIKQTNAKFVFVYGEELYKRVYSLKASCPTLENIFTVRNLHGISHLYGLIELGRSNPQADKLEQIKNSIKADDISCIVYTSGTTGLPKGVMLSHWNILSNAIGVKNITPQTMNFKILSFLPLCHAYEHMLNYDFQNNGYSIYYCDNIAAIADTIKEIGPNLITTVPRLLESIFDKIMIIGRKQKGIKKMIFFAALNLGFNYKSEGNSKWYLFKLWFARKLVFKKWHKALGGNLKMIISGAACLQTRLTRVFWAAGFDLLEGYGLTETSPVIAVSNYDKNGVEFGSVGPILNNVHVKIAEDGEILVKGPNVMKGYYQEPELTKDVFTEDGWFKTGDIGEITSLGNLKVTDRKKEIFKTASGKYISPQLIENKLKESAFIDNAIVVGENQKYAAAIITPNFSHLKSWCAIKKHPYTSNRDAVNDPIIKKRIAREINIVNEQIAVHEKIIKFELLNQSWSTETGELSPTLKLKRKIIVEKFKPIIDKLFN